MLGKAIRFWHKAQLGDREVCDDLLHLYYKPIYAYLRRLCGNTEEAQDLTQETFVKVWKALTAQRRSGNLCAWIYCIARNTWLDSRRKGGRTESRSEDWWESLPAPDNNEIIAMAEREIAEILGRKVHELDEEKRDAIILHYYQGLTLRETAEVLGVATSTVKYRLREALKVLRKEMESENDSSPDAAIPLRKEIRLP
jgi:RNA polymerase sigma-70 factor (ECF subfamily)